MVVLDYRSCARILRILLVLKLNIDHMPQHIIAAFELVFLMRLRSGRQRMTLMAPVDHLGT